MNIKGTNIDVFYDNPVVDNNKQSERVVIKDLPATLPAHVIQAYFLSLSQIRVKSKVLYARERIGGEVMSPYINGDRLVYITPNPAPPLPKETVIGGFPCRIWHRSQKNFCKRCDSHGHRTSDIGLCEAYEADEMVTPFRADSNPLSNFFKCNITFQDRVFKSSEHAYQFTKCMFLNREDLAESVYDAETPRDSKSIAAALHCHEQMAEWTKIKVNAMCKILAAKWNCSGRFRQTLMSTSNMTIAEATQDMFWGVDVAPNLALHTKASKFLGSNHLGRSLMALRDKVQIMDPISIDDITFRFSTPPESPKPINKVSGSDMTSGSETTGNSMYPQSSEPSGDTVQDLSSLNSTENMDTTAAPNISNDDPVSENPSGDTPQPDAIPPPSEYSDNDTSTTPVTTYTSTPPVTTDTSTTPVTTDTSTTPVTTDTSTTPVTTDTSTTPVTTDTSATPVTTDTSTTPVTTDTSTTPVTTDTSTTPVTTDTSTTPVTTDTSTTPVTTDTSATPVTTDTSTTPVTTDTSTTPVTTDTSTTPVTTDTSATPVTTDTSATPVITETPTPIATTSNVHSNTGKITPKENTDADDDVLPPTLFSTMGPKQPIRLPRKSRSLSKELRRNINQGNLDTFVVRDSSMKRKPSGDAIVSPTSDHVAKAIRSDSGEVVS